MNSLTQSLTRITLHNIKTHCCRDNTKVTAFGVTSVRYRKSRWVRRRAPSKIYYVRQPTPKDPEEMNFLDEALRIYNTKLKSIYTYLKLQRKPISEMVKEKISTATDEQEDLEKSLLLNASWNEEIAKERAIRQEKENAVVKQLEEAKLAKYLEELEAEQAKAMNIIQGAKERRADALDMDKLDEELDQFLESDPVDHNFAITPGGERISS